MKKILSLIQLEWVVHCSTLVLAFSAGLMWNSSSTPPSQPLAPRPPGSIRSTSLLVESETEAAPPLDEPAPFSSLAVSGAASPTSRLARLMEAAAHLNEPQTIASLRRLDTEPAGMETKLQRHVLLSRFAEIDPQTALTYVDTLSGGERHDQVANVFTTWASRDPQAAAAKFQASVFNGGLASTEDRDTAAAIAGEWSQKDPRGALDWAASLPEEVRSDARGRVIATLVTRDPTMAAQVAASLPQGYERSEAMKPLAAQWAQSEPSRASAWVQALASPADQSSAAAGLVSTWAHSDPMAASQWISNLRQGPARDAAISALVQAQSLRNDPEAATLWAASVQDPALRQQLVTTTAGEWRRQNPTAATAWLQANAR